MRERFRQRRKKPQPSPYTRQNFTMLGKYLSVTAAAALSDRPLHADGRNALVGKIEPVTLDASTEALLGRAANRVGRYRSRRSPAAALGTSIRSRARPAARLQCVALRENCFAQLPAHRLQALVLATLDGVFCYPLEIMFFGQTAVGPAEKNPVGRPRDYRDQPSSNDHVSFPVDGQAESKRWKVIRRGVLIGIPCGTVILARCE